MSRRAESKAEARAARLAREAREAAAVTLRRRLRALGTVLAVSVAVIVAAIATSSGGASGNPPTGGRVNGAAFSAGLFSGIPQRGTVIGRPNAPVQLIEFADLQCPYCDEYALQALPTLVRDYVRTGKVSMQFENLSFIGPGSVAAGRVAAGAAKQNRLWNFVDLVYLNQGEENSGYITPRYLQRLLAAVPELNVPTALRVSQSSAGTVALQQANSVASQAGINATPSFLIGRAGGPLRQFQPSALAPGPFEAQFNSLLGGHR